MEASIGACEEVSGVEEDSGDASELLEDCQEIANHDCLLKNGTTKRLSV